MTMKILKSSTLAIGLCLGTVITPALAGDNHAAPDSILKGDYEVVRSRSCILVTDVTPGPLMM